ncbi:MAG: TolC family protein [Calditrichia bacterium]
MKFWRIFLTVLLLFPVMAWSQPENKVLTLDDCIKIALTNNFDLNLAKVNNKISHKTYLQSYSDILPTVNFSYDQNKYERGPTSYIGSDYIGENPALPFTYQVTTGRNYSADVQVRQNIFDGGRWYLNIKKSQLDKQSSDYSYLSAKQTAIVTIRQLYLDLLKQEKLLEVDSQAVERSKEQLDRVRSMYEVGSVAQIDVYRSEVNLGNDQITYLNQQNIEKEARRSLNIAMGNQPDAPLQIDANIKFEKEVGELDQMVQEALNNNPQLKAQQFSAYSAKYGVRVAQSAFLPNLSGYFYYTRRVPKFKGLYNQLDREYSWYIGLSLSWNLFNGMSDYLGVQKAVLNRRYSNEQYQYSRLNLKSKVTTLYNNLNALNKIISINQTNLESAKEDYRLAQERYRLGSGTLLDLRDAQVKLATAEQILVTAEFNSYITFAELQQTLGALTDKY